MGRRQRVGTAQAAERFPRFARGNRRGAPFGQGVRCAVRGKTAARQLSLGGKRGERVAPVKDASFLAPAQPVLRILDRIEPAAPLMPAMT